MYPFEGVGGVAKWLLASRFQHLVEATEGLAPRLSEETGEQLERRRKALVAWGRIRIVVLVLLYSGALVTIAAAFGRFLPFSDQAVDLLGDVASIAATFSGVLTLAFFLVTRVLGQLEMDVLTLVMLDVEARTSS